MAYRQWLALALVLTAGVCHADPSSKPWQTAVGAAHVTTFETDYIPHSLYWHAYALADRPDDIFVAPARPNSRLGPQERWIPPGLPLGAYVFVLNLATGKVGLVAWEAFEAMKTVDEPFRSEMSGKHPNLRYGGEPVGHLDLVAPWLKGSGTVAAVSFDKKDRTRTTFGIPSIMPFMGRQNVVEKDTVYSGTMFLEVFLGGNDTAPAVQLTKRFSNYERMPVFDDLATWTRGADQPVLVTVEQSLRRAGIKGKFNVIRPLSSTPRSP